MYGDGRLKLKTAARSGLAWRNDSEAVLGKWSVSVRALDEQLS